MATEALTIYRLLTAGSPPRASQMPQRKPYLHRTREQAHGDTSEVWPSRQLRDLTFRHQVVQPEYLMGLLPSPALGGSGMWTHPAGAIGSST